MTTQAEARTQIIALFRTAWLANGTSSPIPIVYDDVEGGKPNGEDANGRALPWVRISVRHLIEEQDTMGRPGNRRFLAEGIATVEIYTAPGDGHTLGDPLSRIAKLAFRGNSTSGGVWFPIVSPREIGMDGNWFRREVAATFKYEDIG